MLSAAIKSVAALAPRCKVRGIRSNLRRRVASDQLGFTSDDAALETWRLVWKSKIRRVCQALRGYQSEVNEEYCKILETEPR